MQTFLPFPDFNQSARSLDNKRLGKQRAENKQLYTAITGIQLPNASGTPMVVRDGWKHHPAAKMWALTPDALILYAIAILDEWHRRGFEDYTGHWFYFNAPKKIVSYPNWLGNDEFHASHRSNLIRKLPEHYRDRLGWTEPNYLEYEWPDPTLIELNYL